MFFLLDDAAGQLMISMLSHNTSTGEDAHASPRVECHQSRRLLALLHRHQSSPALVALRLLHSLISSDQAVA